MVNNRFTLEVESDLKNIPVISDFIADTLSGFCADQATIYRVQLAVDEACTNIIKHAYSGQKGPVAIICELVNDNLVITIRDKGKPFDPRSVPPPDLDVDLDRREIGGLGIYFMRKMMDEVSYEFSSEEGNKLTMRRRLTLEKPINPAKDQTETSAGRGPGET
jgi:serine/threonine-protein kinase RsbW